MHYQGIITPPTIVLLLLALFPHATALECSDGWYVTGYYTPFESDYEGAKKEIIVIDQQGNDHELTFYEKFLEEVAEEGFGKTIKGDYLGEDANEWHLEKDDIDTLGNHLEYGRTVAVDPGVIPFGRELVISTLPDPWNSYTFRATDEGPPVIGKHIDVFTGEGLKARQETFRITSQNNTVCFS